jgi:dihydrofolate synthase/folylpolyglutamate synthase
VSAPGLSVATLSLTEWLELLESRHPKAIDLGLERCREVWQRMGSPRPAARIITVAGTNGKGSTVAYLCGMLEALGHSFGSYTTPHLLQYNERIQINGICTRDEPLLEAFETVEAARGHVSLSYFEFGTLAAIHILSRAGLDFAIMEVGLGGRLDAVNILDTDCALITPIGLDHQEYLGEDRESIGREKAGIIRRNTPLICGEADPPASILAAAEAVQAPLWRLGREFEAYPKDGSIRFRKGQLNCLLPAPQMGGDHQLNNMATALAALLEVLAETKDKIPLLVRGLENVAVPGRLQQVSTRPLVMIDVGHNPMAAEAVAKVLQDSMKGRPGSRCRCVIAMLADKDAASVAGILGSLVSDWYCAGLPGDRGQTGAELAARIGSGSGGESIHVCPDVDQALDQALKVSSPEDCILVFGSFLTAGAALDRCSGGDLQASLFSPQGTPEYC